MRDDTLWHKVHKDRGGDDPVQCHVIKAQPDKRSPICRHAPPAIRWGMTPTGLAVFVFLAFLLPIPLIQWLDTPRSEPSREER